MDDQLTVLVVDDEDLIGLMIGDSLEAEGFGHEICHAAADAIDRLDNGRAAYCAVVTDIRLGEGQTGWDVARHARTIRADIPIIYISGDSAPEHGAYGVPDSVMIQKPFVGAQIITALSTLLNMSG